MTGTLRRWPLVLIAAPAAVAVWSGWVGLGGMCGFGIVHPLPGILPGFQLDTAITLPVGVEAYGAYALGAWLAPAGVPVAARTFARRSAVGALALGMLGQVVYHLLAAAHAGRAPWPVVVLVSCMPVTVLGFGAALTHLQRPQTVLDSAPEVGLVRALEGAREAAPVGVPETAPVGAPGALPRSTSHRRTPNRAPEAIFAAELSAGTVPGIRSIKSRCRVGQDTAKAIQERLAALVTTPVSEPREIVEVGG